MRRNTLAVLFLMTLAACGTAPATVYVVRHGEAVLNVEHPPGLTADELDRLTPAGREQARALGARLAPRGAARVLASPLGRARETAGAIADALGLTAEVTSALAPLGGGRPAPLAFSDRVAGWAHGRDPRPEGGESLADGRARALAAIEAAARPGEALVVVTHSDIVAALLGHAAGTPLAELWPRHEVPQGSVSIVELEDGRAGLVEQARTRR